MKARQVFIGATIVAGVAGCGGAPLIYPVDGRMDLPPCVFGHPREQDCTITGPAMAIDMMTRRPDRETQPNAYYQYKLYEREREREIREKVFMR
jgi:hypothetical protein